MTPSLSANENKDDRLGHFSDPFLGSQSQNMELPLLAGPLSPEGVVLPPFQTTGLRHHHLL